MGHPTKNVKQRIRRAIAISLVIIFLFWVITHWMMIGFVPPSGYCLSIGGGCIEYGYGWGWIRQKMIGHGRIPPMGWFVSKGFDFPSRTYAPICIPFYALVAEGGAIDCLFRWWPSQERIQAAQSLGPLLIWAAISIPISMTLKALGFESGVGSASDFIPCALAVLITLAIPIASYIRNRRRYRLGHCQSCGYDLTGNKSGICPECGTAISVGAATT